MSKTTDVRERYRRIWQEHEEIRQLITALHQTFAERQASRDQVETMLRSLKDHAAGHFADERESGFLKDIVARAPELADRTAACEMQHTEMLRMLDGLCEMAAHELSVDNWDKLESGFREFNTTLTRHETEECELLQVAYDQDGGGGAD